MPGGLRKQVRRSVRRASDVPSDVLSDVVKTGKMLSDDKKNVDICISFIDTYVLPVFTTSDGTSDGTSDARLTARLTCFLRPPGTARSSHASSSTPPFPPIHNVVN